MNVASVFDRFGGPYLVGALLFSPILKIGPIPTPGSTSVPEPGIDRFGSASGQDVAHVARVPAAPACSRDASVVESVGDGLQRRGACLPSLSDDRQYVVGEPISLGLASFATAATDRSEVEVTQLDTTRLGCCHADL